MHIQALHFLYDYNYWARDRLLGKAKTLSLQQFLAPTALDHGSIRNILAHILSAEWIWRRRCQEGDSPTKLLSFKDFQSVTDLQRRWQEEEALMRGYLSALAGADLSQAITYHTTRGEPRQNVLWHLLVHVVNHGTEHRSQVAAALTASNLSPGDLDIVHYLRETEW
jgi:uncharacterized damage-inducible protein DinB